MSNMMQEVQKNDPKLVAKMIDLLESGVSAEDIGKRLQEDAEKEQLEQIEGPPDEEHFPDEIKLISQALAYREVIDDDLIEICALLNHAYRCEIDGPESFRIGNSINIEQLINMYDDKSSYKWLLCEAPSGRGVEKDGVILGISIFSIDGVSKRNGEIEGKLGKCPCPCPVQCQMEMCVCVFVSWLPSTLLYSALLYIDMSCLLSTNNYFTHNIHSHCTTDTVLIPILLRPLGSIRYFGILPRFHGLFIGLRLLKKTELIMFTKYHCIRCMTCCSSSRRSLASWYERRGYSFIGKIKYPFEILQQVLQPKYQYQQQQQQQLQFTDKGEEDADVNVNVDAAAEGEVEVEGGNSNAKNQVPTSTTSTSKELKLFQFLKKLDNTSADSIPIVADTKGHRNKSPEKNNFSNNDGDSGDRYQTQSTVIRLAYDNSVTDSGSGSIPSWKDEDEDDDNDDDEEEETDEQKRIRLGMPYVEGKMHLPPHWRHPNPNLPTPPVDPTGESVVDDEGIPLD
jgi:hypothetical protein